jgi:Leucine-rich repeat (LRR) protein
MIQGRSLLPLLALAVGCAGQQPGAPFSHAADPRLRLDLARYHEQIEPAPQHELLGAPGAAIDFCGAEAPPDATTLRCRSPVTSLSTLDAFSDLSAITQLDVESDTSTRAIDLTPLARQRAITRLGLRAQGFTETAALAPLKGLEALSLGGSMRLVSVDGLKGLPKLMALDLTSTAVREIGALAGLPLESLSLADTEVTNIAPLAKLTRLRALNLSGLAIRDVSALSSLTALEELDLGHTDVRDLRPLAKLGKLRRLVLWHTPVSEIGPLATLTQLEALYLDGTRVRDVGVLAKLPALEQLGLAGVAISERELEPLRTAHPRLFAAP